MESVPTSHMRIPVKPGGQGDAADFLRAVWDAIWGPGGSATRQIQTPNTLVSQTTRGTQIIVKPSRISTPPAATATGTTRYWFHDMRGDYLICLTSAFLTGVPTAADMVRIAKPYKLRNSLNQAIIDGVTYLYTYPFNPPTTIGSPDAYRRRTATVQSSPSVQIKEVIVPRYLKFVSGLNTIRDEIYASTATNGSGVVSELNDGLGQPAGQAITLIEDNRDGRAWSKKRSQET